VSELPVAEFLQGLREAHETYKHLVEGIPASLYVDAVDDLSTNLYTSPQIQTLLGFTVQEWTEDPNLWIARMHEDDRERVVRAHQESNRTGGPFNTEYRVYARDGSVVWVHDEAVLVRDENGEPMYWRGIMSDLSKQKQAEEKLRKSLDVLRRTMEDRRQLLLRLEDAQEEERRRIAADIHDDSVQAMAAGRRGPKDCPPRRGVGPGCLRGILSSFAASGPTLRSPSASLPGGNTCPKWPFRITTPRT